jgi:hypothetical protein
LLYEKFTAIITDFCRDDVVVLQNQDMGRFAYYLNPAITRIYNMNSTFDRPHNTERKNAIMYAMVAPGEALSNKLSIVSSSLIYLAAPLDARVLHVLLFYARGDAREKVCPREKA